MFSFFKRKKPQDDGDKREKSKGREKTGSPFFRRKEPQKTEEESPKGVEEITQKKGEESPMGWKTYLDSEESPSFSSDTATTVELNCSGQDLEKKFTLPSVFLNPTVDMTVVVRRRTPEPESRPERQSTDRDRSGTSPVLDVMGTSPSREPTDDEGIGSDDTQSESHPATDCTRHEEYENRGTDILEELPLSAESHTEETTPDESTLSEEMTYEERGNTDESRVEPDLKIVTDGKTDYFDAEKRDNTEIDDTDIAPNNENNSAERFENPTECVAAEIPELHDDNEEDTVEVEKMSGAVNPGGEEADEKIVKRVRWADIEGGTDLCCADLTESEEEESSDEEEEEESSDEEEEESSREDGTDNLVGVGEIKSEQSVIVNRTEEGSSCESTADSSDKNEDGDEKLKLTEGTAKERGETFLEMSRRDCNSEHLSDQVSDLQHKLLNKTAGMERLQNELESVYNESELARKRFRRLQDELDACKRCNLDLIDRLNKQPGTSNLGVIEEDQLKEAEERVTELERKLAAAREENAHLHSSLKKLEKEREQEMRIVQQALDDALEEQNRIETKFGREFEQLRTVNTNRELKLIDDFEWKLREVEKSCKKQIQDKDKLNDQKIVELCAKLSSAEAALEKVSHLKNCESELKHLRNITHDQKKSLRTLTRQLEELQVNEKVLQEETNRLRTALEQEKANFSAIQSLHKEDLAEKDRRLHFRLDMQKNHLEVEWEEKLRRECSRVKIELERTFREEKRQAVEATKHTKEQENVQNEQIWEKRIQDFIKEIENLKRKLAQKEENHKRALENAQSKYDSDILELRRKMDKLDMSYQEKIEKMQEAHEQELAKITEENERKIQQCETNLQAQAGTTRTTLELVKQQMQKEAELRVQEVRSTHERELEEQWHQLMGEKEKELNQIEDRHKEVVEHLQNEIATLKKKYSREEPPQKPSSSGFGKSLIGLFEKKDPSQKHNKIEMVAADTFQENKPEREGFHDEPKENNLPRKEKPEEPNCTRDCQQKKQRDDKREAGQKESTNKRHHRRSRKSKSGKR